MGQAAAKQAVITPRSPDGASDFEAADDVHRVSAAGDGEDAIVFSDKTGEGLGENILVRGIVGPSGDHGNVVGERDAAETRATGGDGAFGQIASKVGSERGTAAIAKKENGAVLGVGLPEVFDHAIENGVVEAREHVADGCDIVFRGRKCRNCGLGLQQILQDLGRFSMIILAVREA